MPAAATPAALRTQLASGRLDALYLIKGDDDAEKGALAHLFIATIDEGLQAFNYDRFYGGDPGVTPSAIIQAARTLPMMAPRRVVLVLRAERLLIPKRESEASERELETLAGYFDNPDPTATVVFVADAGLDERRRVVKRLVQRATVVECAGPGDGAHWARSRAGEEGLQFQPDALRLLVARAGADATRLRADVERVVLYAQGNDRITAADVDAVTAGATSQDPWAVANAIERGDAATALRELALAFDGGAVPYMVLGQLAWIARAKLPGARVPAAIDAVFRTDLALKSSGGDPRVLLERLVVELCGK